ncbi:hypothetical protein X798_03340 [Onchocerca flexuosa]|uniref:AF4/FMR2 C-terminal homology domain-containing protein n=2 Tax=Onchocerca flexuosa TaxID=387005 RepID=A0A238BXK4_9BILA|nr:hypothetical protein X798_03340 [Onchocerca flexuosa]
MNNNHSGRSDLRETVDPDTQIQKAMTEDSEPRIARIRENLVNGLGPFDLMADIIVGSQHSPNNSGLFGVVQSPIKPLRPSFGSSSSISPTSESHVTATQMAQKMQNIVDVPLSAIHTNLPFKKNQERKNNVVRGAEANVSSAVMNASTGDSRPSTASDRTSDNSCRKKKRRRSDCNNLDTENWQKPCTSSITTKMECDDTKMTISELFGEEKSENGDGKKQPDDVLKNMEKKIVKWEKEERESPDSGFADEITDHREQFHRPRLQTIIGELGHISPLLTPPRHPQKSDGPTLPVIINLDHLDSAHLLRIRNLFIKNAPVFLSAVAVPSCILSPPMRPTSRNERDGTLQLCDSDFKPVPKSTTIDGSGNRVTICKKIHSAGATPSSSSSSTKEFKKENIPRCGSASIDDRKQELAALKNENLKITLVKKFIKQCDKTYVTASATSNIKESERRNKRDGSTPTNCGSEQLPSTSKLGKKSLQPKSASHVSNDELADVLKGKDKKGCLDNEHSREKEKSAASRRKDCNGLNDQQVNSGIATTQLHEVKKKHMNDAAVSTVNNNIDNMRVKIAKNSKYKDAETPAKKCKKDTNVENKFADEMQEVDGDFICCRSHTAPAKKAVLEKNDDGSYKCANYYLDEVARPLKHRADKENGDHVRKTLAYMDAAVYFILSSATERENRQRQYMIARDSAELMKTIIKWSGASAASLSPLERHFISRFRMLSFRVQAVLNYYLYSLKMGMSFFNQKIFVVKSICSMTFSMDLIICMSNFGALTKWELQLTELDAAAVRNDGAASVNSQGGSSANTETPSPASSTNSGHLERQKEISVPVSIYQAQRSQLSILHHLMWSDRLWKQTSTKMNSSEQEMVKHLDQICGPLTVDLNLHSLSEYLATAVTWLRTEYRAEKERLSPSLSFSQQLL